jgi:uncharacterized protein with GYD domain
MPTYITLIQFTQKGMESIRESPSRLDNVRRAVEAAGGRYIAFYMTMGRYDGALISEAPDDATVARTLLMVGALGNVRTETLRAFTEDEFRQLVGGLP